MSKSHKKTFRSCGASPTPDLDVVRYGVGLDVHKYKIAACVTGQISDGTIVTVKEHAFRASPSGLQELASFLKKYIPVSHYLMECTGVYHLPVYRALLEAFPDRQNKVVAMNPLMIHRRIGDLGRHSDRTDAQGLSILTHYDGLIRPSYIGSVEFTRLRQTIRQFHTTKVQVNRTKNRIKQSLDAENLKFPLDLKSEWSLELLDYFVHGDQTFGEAFSGLLMSRIRDGKGVSVLKKRAKDAVEYADVRITKQTRFMLQMYLAKLLYLEGECATYLTQGEAYVLKEVELAEDYEKLLEIPGVGSVTALTILVELGDYNRFRGWKALVKYCGVVPIVDQSGEHKSKGHLNRHTNARLRRALTQSAGVLINLNKQDSDLGRFAHRQYRVRRIPYKKALIKVAHKLARTIYNILVLGVDFDPNHEYVNKRRKDIQNKREKQGTLLETSRTRALRRDISQFFVSNYDFLNSTSKYHLKAGFKRVIRKAKRLDDLKRERIKKCKKGKRKK